MISQKTVAFLHENNYGVSFSEEHLEVYHKASVKIIWPIFTIFLGIALIPSIGVGGFKLGLLVLLLLIFPAYKMMKDFREPKNLIIDLKSKKIGIKSKVGKLREFSFSFIKQVNLSTFDEYLEPNAFQEEVMQRHFYVDLVFKNGLEKTIMSFKEINEKDVNRLTNELKSLFTSGQTIEA